LWRRILRSKRRWRTGRGFYGILSRSYPEIIRPFR
jgi:hypothetical protein